jgi:hypothetical protein
MKRQPPRHPPENASYEVGYCKPPKDERFKPGQSGNPKGRPRGARNLRTAVREALQAKVEIREGGRTRRISKMDAIIQVTLNKGLKGDPKGLAAIVQLARLTGLMDEEPDTSANENLSAQEKAIMADFFARHGIEVPELDGEGSVADAGKNRKEPNATEDENEKPEGQA